MSHEDTMLIVDAIRAVALAVVGVCVMLGFGIADRAAIRSRVGR